MRQYTSLFFTLSIEYSVYKNYNFDRKKGCIKKQRIMVVCNLHLILGPAVVILDIILVLGKMDLDTCNNM